MAFYEKLHEHHPHTREVAIHLALSYVDHLSRPRVNTWTSSWSRVLVPSHWTRPRSECRNREWTPDTPPRHMGSSALTTSTGCRARFTLGQLHHFAGFCRRARCFFIDFRRHGTAGSLLRRLILSDRLLRCRGRKALAIGIPVR